MGQLSWTPVIPRNTPYLKRYWIEKYTKSPVFCFSYTTVQPREGCVCAAIQKEHLQHVSVYVQMSSRRQGQDCTRAQPVAKEWRVHSRHHTAAVGHG